MSQDNGTDMRAAEPQNHDQDRNTSPQGSPFTDILDNVFMAGLGIAAADDIEPEDHDRAILNTQKHYTKEAEQALLQVLEREKKQYALNVLTQLKQDRINHTLSTPVNEWIREIDFIDQHILALGINGEGKPHGDSE